MCGIAGYYMKSQIRNPADDLIRMTRSIRHREPDGEGSVLVNTQSHQILNLSGRDSDPRIRDSFPEMESQGIEFPHDLAFSHRRYSIIDLSPGGHQPMWGAGGTVCVSFNGEIYNYVELRAELENVGHKFDTRSDTEVLLKAYIQWGTDAFVRFNGPWVLALYDMRRNGLLLSRDRIGKSPLYYALRNGCLYWASEIKAILSVCGVTAYPVRGQAVDDYLVYGRRDVSGTFWEGVEDFPPASYAWIQPDLSLKTERYWQLPEQRMTRNDLFPEEATAKFRDLLMDAISLRMRADVPVAFELSGGMDSSSLVSLAASGLSERITTFTVKFPEKHSDEEHYARALAEHHGGKIDYHVIRGENEDFWTDADDFVWLEEEPFHLPNLHTIQCQRRKIKESGAKVVIAGSAGDELLAGYVGEYYIPFLGLLLENGRYSELFNEIRLGTEYSLMSTLYKLLRARISPNLDRGCSIIRGYLDGIYRPTGSIQRSSETRGDFSAIMQENMTHRKMNYWMRSGNKATFGIPIEPRLPFLDYRVVDFAFSLPPEYLIHDGWHKWVLRMATKDTMPKEIVWRRTKMGFPFPLREWLVQSKSMVTENLYGLECPYLDETRLLGAYGSLLKKNPGLLWRLISLALWWRKVMRETRILNRE